MKDKDKEINRLKELLRAIQPHPTNDSAMVCSILAR